MENLTKKQHRQYYRIETMKYMTETKNSIQQSNKPLNFLPEHNMKRLYSTIFVRDLLFDRFRGALIFLVGRALILNSCKRLSFIRWKCWDGWIFLCGTGYFACLYCSFFFTGINVIFIAQVDKYHSFL